MTKQGICEGLFKIKADNYVASVWDESDIKCIGKIMIASSILISLTKWNNIQNAQKPEQLRPMDKGTKKS